MHTNVCLCRIEILVAKLDAANVRLSERQLFDENVNNKFNALTKELSELKLIQSINDTREIDSHTSVDDKENVRHKKISLADEIKMLKEKIANMEEELEVSNKRADENEARTEKIVHENEQIKRVHKNTEVNYQLTITKLRNRCQELREANSEQKEVAEGIYKELNKTLVLCASLERDRNEMKMQLELMKGGESNIQKLKDALGDENRRVLALEKECENLRHEIHILQGNISLLVDKNKQAKEVSEQIQKNLIEKSHDAKRYLQNLDKVEEEKRNLANSLVSLRRNYMKISDRLIDVQGNIRIFCRVRPLLEAEFTQHYNEAKQSHTLAHATSVAAVRELNSMIKYIDYDTLEFDQHLYKYDRIFTPDENQEEVYDEVESIVRAAISGNNCCIFAYGQTGSG